MYVLRNIVAIETQKLYPFIMMSYVRRFNVSVKNIKVWPVNNCTIDVPEDEPG
jgi:hypothetical protein